jgi:hypothetical protein
MNRTRHALSLMETVIGLAMFGLIASAVAAFASATGDAWAQGRALSQSGLAATRASVAFDELVRGVCAAVWVESDDDAPASILVWEADRLLEPDGVLQVGELMLIEHDVGAGVIWVYKTIPWTSMTDTQRELALVSDWSAVNWGEFAETFKTLSIVGEPTALAGLRRSEQRGEGVLAARIDALEPAGGRPTIALDMVFDDGQKSRRLLSSVTLRSHRAATNVSMQQGGDDDDDDDDDGAEDDDDDDDDDDGAEDDDDDRSVGRR